MGPGAARLQTLQAGSGAQVWPSVDRTRLLVDGRDGVFGMNRRVCALLGVAPPSLGDGGLWCAQRAVIAFQRDLLVRSCCSGLVPPRCTNCEDVKPKWCCIVRVVVHAASVCFMYIHVRGARCGNMITVGKRLHAACLLSPQHTRIPKQDEKHRSHTRSHNWAPAPHANRPGVVRRENWPLLLR